MMKATLSLTLVVALTTSALPVTAQEQINKAAGPISRAMTLEAVRLAAEPAVVSADQKADSSNADWSRVRKLEPGTEITVTVRDSQASKRYFVSADEAGLTVLDLADPTLPAAATRALRDTASHHPGYFASAETVVFVDRDVRVGPGGVFVANRKVADLGQIVLRIPRADVVSVEGSGNHHMSTGAKVGIVAGVIGGVITYAVCGTSLVYRYGCIGH